MKVLGVAASVMTLLALLLGGVGGRPGQARADQEPRLRVQRTTAPPDGVTARQRIAVPSYFYPGSFWTQLDGAAPEAGLAVINPSSGPGISCNPDYANQVKASESAGLSVVGYVYTQYAARSLSQVEADVDTYYSCYPMLDGIFFDQGSTDCTNLTYYQTLNAYVKAKGGEGLTVINPGTRTNECYMSAADVLVTFEGDYSTYVGSGYAQPGWVRNYSASRFWHLIYGAPDVASMQRAIRMSKQRRAGWVYVTPDALPNPWDTLPDSFYWNAELRAVQPGGADCVGRDQLAGPVELRPDRGNRDCRAHGHATVSGDAYSNVNAPD